MAVNVTCSTLFRRRRLVIHLKPPAKSTGRRLQSKEACRIVGDHSTIYWVALPQSKVCSEWQLLCLQDA